MPRAVFAKKDNFEAWTRDQVGKKIRHAMYVTNSSEAILVPTVSTSPRMVGYYKGSADEMNLLMHFSKEIGIPVYRVKAFEWDTEKPVGVVPRY